MLYGNAFNHLIYKDKANYDFDNKTDKVQWSQANELEAALCRLNHDQE